jgi:hypothetical protein
VKKILIGIFLISLGLVSSLNGQSNLPSVDILQAQSYVLEKYTWLNHANYGLETESVKQSAIGLSKRTRVFLFMQQVQKSISILANNHYLFLQAFFRFWLNQHKFTH